MIDRIKSPSLNEVIGGASIACEFSEGAHEGAEPIPPVHIIVSQPARQRVAHSEQEYRSEALSQGSLRLASHDHPRRQTSKPRQDLLGLQARTMPDG